MENIKEHFIMLGGTVKKLEDFGFKYIQYSDSNNFKL